MAALNKVHGRDARGNDWIQESYETGDPELRARASDLRRRGYHVRSVSLGSQVTQYGRVKITMLDIRVGRSGDDYLEQVNPRRSRRRKVSSRKTRNAGPRSVRKSKKVARARGQTYYETKPFKFRKFRQPKDIRRGYLTGQPKLKNPPRVKGRKVKGGRSVTLRNFTGTIVRKSDGTVNILGRGRRR